jgi:hypothetical protein
MGDKLVGECFNKLWVKRGYFGNALLAGNGWDDE